MNTAAKHKCIGVDLGATNIRSGKIINGKVVNLSKNKVPQTTDGQVVIEQLIQTIENTFDNHIKAIGVGVPSLLDRKNGIVYQVQNIPSWEEVPLKRILESHFKVPVNIDNDANCFALGERVFGAGKNFEDFVGLSIGTGLGCGIIKEGKLIQDTNGCSGEFGSLFYLDSIVEDYCSSKFFINHYNTTGAELFEKAKRSESVAIESFREFGYHLGKAIQMILFSVDPEAIILGGSIAEGFEFFSASMFQTLNEFPYQNMIKKLKIIRATSTDTAILGAGALCFDQNN